MLPAPLCPALAPAVTRYPPRHGEGQNKLHPPTPVLPDTRTGWHQPRVPALPLAVSPRVPRTRVSVHFQSHGIGPRPFLALPALDPIPRAQQNLSASVGSGEHLQGKDDVRVCWVLLICPKEMGGKAPGSAQPSRYLETIPRGDRSSEPSAVCSSLPEGSPEEAGSHSRQYSLSHLGCQVVDSLLVQVAAEERDKVAGQGERLCQ